MARALLLPVLVLFITNLCAQDLHIYYDMHKDTVWYMHNDKPISAPKVHKNGNIFLHVSEYNNYRYDINVVLDLTQKTSLVNDAAAIESGGSGADGGAPSVLGMLGQMAIPGFDMAFGSGPGGMFESLLGGARGGQEVARLKMAHQLEMEMVQLESEINTVLDDVKTTVNMLAVSALIDGKIDELIYSSSMPPSEAKSLAMQYYRLMFGIEGNELDLKTALDWNARTEQLFSQARKLNLLSIKWRSKSTELEQHVRQLERIEFDDPKYVEAVSSLSNTSEQAFYIQNTIDSLYTATQRMKGALNTLSPQKLADLQQRFTELQSNSFQHHETFYPIGDAMDLVFTVTLSDSMLRRKGLEDAAPVRVRTFRIHSYGGIKIAPGAGVSFAQYLERPQTFSTRDDVIVANDADRFLPAVSSMLHFYSNNGKNFAMGGTFGVGLPLLSSNTDPSLLFMLGPCAVIGQNQRIVVSGGFLGGKTSRLANGYQIGDAFDGASAEIPTSTKYEFGYYWSLSFNISGN